MTISGNFKRFQYFNFETDLLGGRESLSGTGVLPFGCGHLGSRRVICVWGRVRGPGFCRWLLYFSGYLDSVCGPIVGLVWCAGAPGARASRGRWSSIWRCFFTVNILKLFGDPGSNL